MRVGWRHLIAGLVILPLAALLVAWSGVVNVGASSGHWKVTDWFLHFVMRSSVRTYALAIDVPEELPSDGIQPAAGHFARGCAMCHGAPGEPRSVAALKMLPKPPDLVEVVDEWSDSQLFQIVKHGVRFTGMPSWPAHQRDDEVWAMVAFLRTLPSMDATQYTELAYGSGNVRTDGSESDFERILADCTRCHGTDGLGRSALTPILAGQNESYLHASLRAYAEGLRPSGVMRLPAAGANPETLARLASHFALLPRPTVNPVPPDPAFLTRGEEIARGGIPRQNIPACRGCHTPDNRNHSYPILAGQPARYLEQQLKLFRAQKRGGTAYSHLMARAAKGLTDADVIAVAAYFASLSAPGATPGP